MYSYDEVLLASQKYFQGDELAGKVFTDKYALRDDSENYLEKDPSDMHRRLAKEFARVELNKFKVPMTEDVIYSFFNRFQYIIPQGSVLYGCGNNYQTVSLSNCFVCNSPEDSYGGILNTDEQLVQISKRRGGVGIDLSKLRPSGFPTKNSSRKSTGIKSWMRRYSNSIREVGQDGRRGALMLTLSVHHPDILEFINLKNDPLEVTGANISVRYTDEFLKAVEEGNTYQLRFPVDSKNIVGEISAKDVWNAAVHSAWNRAEPGIIFWDNICNYNAIDCYSEEGFSTKSTNPCQPGWAPVLTRNGITKLENINIGDEIWSKEGWTRVINKAKTGVKQVYHYGTNCGTFYGTVNHQVVSNNNKIEVDDADSIDILSGPFDSNITISPSDVIDGIVMGDGSIHKASDNLIYLCIGKDDQDYFNSEVAQFIGKYRSALGKTSYEVKTNIRYTELPYTYQRIIPDRYFYADRNKVAGFLRGIYTANGSICDNRVTLKSASKKLVLQVQIMLSSLGIRSYYTTNKPSTIEWKNGSYTSKESYDLNISVDKYKFFSIIGFIQQYKNEKLSKLINRKRIIGERSRKTYDIHTKTFHSTELVYDITVDNDSHTYWTSGLNVSNCAELPLCEYDSCRLLIQNLFSYVINPFTSESRFDWVLFSEHAKIAQRLMDDLIDLEIEKIKNIIKKLYNDPEDFDIKTREIDLWENILQKCVNGRRTGLGITGEADMLASLGMKYGSDKSIEMVEAVHMIQKLASYQSSCDMAKELGPFPIWNWQIEKDSDFLLQIRKEDPTLYKNISKYGRRNIGNLTIAPVGSVSLLTQTTSGIEPLFMLEPYKRRKKINPSDKNVRVDFTDPSGDSWQEFEIVHPKLRLWMDITGNKNWKESPWYGCCAEDLDWNQRVKLQAAAQRHIDHAISSTLNLPEDVTEDKVNEIFMTAWKAGCKGITVYRKNCRTGVLVEKNDNSSFKFIKRPRELNCDIYHVSIKGKQHTVCVGMLDEKPYEVLVIEEKTVRNLSTGKIIKRKRGWYDLYNDSEIVYENITGWCNGEEGNITRLVSTLLRHDVPADYVSDQLNKVSGDINGFARSISRCLKKYIPDNTKTNERCECCKGNLQYKEGCKSCINCGWSKCS